MNKAQIAAVFLAGTAAGVGGKQALEALGPGAAVAQPSVPFAHAVDLRRSPKALAPKVLVYGSMLAPDGGVRDVGQAQSCTPSEATLKTLGDGMNALGRECRWEEAL